ncbi:hypothetical protein F5Y10DRAFT_277265 [Nemania abortiva]|nr:hypothetical protein F5Y10DRAFT_277265 [Nemania abortiva]
MAEPENCDEGDYFPFDREHSPNVAPPPQPKTEATPPGPKPVRSLTPRGQRFSRLSDAFLNITSRQASNNTTHKALDQSQSPTATSDLVALTPPSVTSPRLVKSQDDIQVSSSALAMPSCMKKARRASFDSIDFFEGLSPKMGRADSKHLSLSEEIESELLNLKAQSQDTTGSTIEGILAQYNAGPSSIEVQYDNTREHRAKQDLSISKPPQESLPERPLINHSITRQTECDSSVSNSSITDSQHLLDAEAQASELEGARRAVVPLPLNIYQYHRGMDLKRESQHATFAANRGEIRTNNPFADPEVDDHYKTYLQIPMERDISQRLRHARGNVGNSAGTFYSSACSGGHEDFSLRHIRPQGNIFNPSSVPKVRAAGKPLRHINVVIGRESKSSKNGQNHYGTQVNAENGYRDVVSEDGDWVTEATSDVGFDFGPGSLPGRPLVGGFKRAGSSIADYSDEGNEDTMDRFGSRERIIQHSADKPFTPCDVQRQNESKFAVLRDNASSENANRRWESTRHQETSQFRPQILRKNTNPRREFANRWPGAPQRLVFDFDQNAPPRYQFRDSISDYEPATASTKANCGTNQYGTQGSLPSPVSEIEEGNHDSTTDARFDRSADFDAERNPSNRFSQQARACQIPHGTQGIKLSIYAAERQKQLEELQRQEFAAASSYYDPPSASSVRSKFNFELLPLNLAQVKNKRQRDNGETNETESAAARLKRKKGTSSIDPETSPLERPARAFFTSRDLSVNFSPSDWQAHDVDLADTPTPFGMGPFDESAPNKRRKYRNDSGSENLDAPSSPYTPEIPYTDERRLWYHQTRHYDIMARNMRPLIVPDDYVSDRADRNRRYCFFVLVLLSILPFVGVLVLSGAFSEALKWATRGEVDRLTHCQRRFIKIMLIVEFVVYIGAAVAISVFYAVKNKNGN